MILKWLQAIDVEIWNFYLLKDIQSPLSFLYTANQMTYISPIESLGAVILSSQLEAKSVW